MHELCVKIDLSFMLQEANYDFPFNLLDRSHTHLYHFVIDDIETLIESSDGRYHFFCSKDSIVLAVERKERSV